MAMSVRRLFTGLEGLKNHHLRTTPRPHQESGEDGQRFRA
jgi:hypothetical protein